MNEMPRFKLLAMLSALLIAGCSPAGRDAPPLQGASIGGPFTLTDQDGKRVSDEDFKGQYRLVYFGFTYCPDVCPVDLQQIGQGLRQFEREDPGRAARVQPIFISVDPARDTPSVLKQYVAAFHPRLVGLTGSPEEIADVAKKFAVYYSRDEQQGESDYLVNHARVAMLFGPDGKPIAILPHDQGAEAIAAELGKWVT